MTEKKKKNHENKSVNAFIFILFWLISLGFLQLSSLDIWANIYNFIVLSLPPIFHRLWIAFLLHGFLSGLGLGLAQKVAIQALKPVRLKYWIWLSLIVFSVTSMARYLTLRYVDWQIYEDTAYYFLAITLISHIILITGQWVILRQNFKQAWLWLVMILIPFLSNFVLNALYTNPEFWLYPISQNMIAALILLWINHQSKSSEKSKNMEEAEARLLDKLDESQNEIEEIQKQLGTYQAADA